MVMAIVGGPPAMRLYAGDFGAFYAQFFRKVKLVVLYNAWGLAMVILGKRSSPAAAPGGGPPAR